MCKHCAFKELDVALDIGRRNEDVHGNGTRRKTIVRCL